MRQAIRITHPVVAWLPLICFYWYLLTGFWGIDGHRTAFSVLVIYFLYWAWLNWKILRSSSLFWIALCLSVYTAIRTGAGYAQDPETFALQMKFGQGLVGMGGFFAIFLIPWVIGPQKESRYDRAFPVLLLSLLIQVFLELTVHPDGVSLAQIPSGRPNFQMGPNSFGFICGMLLVGMVSLSWRYLKKYSSFRSTSRVMINIILLFSTFAGLGFGVLVTQSRSSWLATSVTLVFVIGSILRKYASNKSFFPTKRLIGILVLISLIFGTLIFSHWQLISNRITAETHIVQDIFEKDIYDLSKNSITRRLKMWKASFETIQQNFVFGISPGQVYNMLDSHLSISRHYYQSHNLFLEVFVSLGAVGFILFVTMLLIAIREIRRSRKKGTIPYEWSLCCSAMLMVVIIEGMFDFLMSDSESVFVYTFLLAMVMALQIENNRGMDKANAT